MKTSDLVYIGIKGSVIALNRASGEQIWATHLKGSDFVNVLVEDNKLFATCSGEAFCLDPATGEGLWHNRLKGLGTGLATIATEDTLRHSLTTVLSEKRRRDEQAAASASTGAIVAG
ncbi:MAG: PQQ-binding-like beta-propeller repeat protein [Verrucomicrobiota bacterium]